ncbi:MAG: hypothetical protein H6556_23400 [Lewinellaceae bacterium]|nr:hypothetical protein [Lewinellaceae bacterium]
MTKLSNRSPLEKINRLKQSNQDQINTLISQLAYTSPFTFLFDLSVFFEQQYAHLGPDKRMQVAGVWLGKLIKEVLAKKALPTPKKPDAALQEELLGRLVQLNDAGMDETLVSICRLFETNEFLEDFRQIHQYDDNCELRAYGEGCIRTVVKEGRFAGLKNYIRDGMKYEKLADYYFNKGRIEAFELLKSGNLALADKTEDDLDHLAHQIAAQSFLEHYGVEPEFTMNGQHYHTALLIQLLSFLIIYTRSRYGVPWEEQAGEDDTVKRIFSVWGANLKERGRQTPRSLFVSSWEKFIRRANTTFKNKWTKEDIEQHLLFFSSRVDGSLKYLNIFEKPLLLLDDKVAFFARPLMMQNGWVPVLLPLIKRTSREQPEGANARVKRSTELLGQKFREHDFIVLNDVDLIIPDTGKSVTDIDLLAIKENHLFVMQLKMTYPRATLREAWKHRKDKLAEGGEQVKSSIDYLAKYWPEFRAKLNIQKDWAELKVTPLVVSTSFEYDRDLFSGFLKISQFELERYLENDAFLLSAGHEDLLENNSLEIEFKFYRDEEKLSGQRLRELIHGNALWGFLEPCVFATPVDGFLPVFGFPGTPAAQAEELFQKGNLRYNQGAFSQAATYYRQAIAHFPDYETYHIGLGNALASDGKRRKSLVHFDNAIEINPFSGEAYYARGLTYHQLRLTEHAIRDLRKAITYSSWDLSAWVHLAQALLDLANKTGNGQLIEEARRTIEVGLMIFDHLPSEKQEMYQEQAQLLSFLAQF